MIDLPTLKRSLSISALLREYGITLKLNRCSCPLHQEKTPSFTVFNDERFTCFGCGEYGDVIQLYAKLENLSTGQAIRQLAARIGLKGKPSPPRRQLAYAREEAEVCAWWWKRLLESLGHVGSIELARDAADMEFLRSAHNVTMWARGISPAERLALYQRSVTSEERAEYRRECEGNEWLAEWTVNWLADVQEVWPQRRWGLADIKNGDYEAIL